MRSLLTSIKSKAIQAVRKGTAFRLIGIVLFGVILTQIDLRAALRILAAANPFFLILTLTLQMVALVFATTRWQLIMRRLDIRVPFLRSVVYSLIGTSAALVTPGQLGEFVKVLYLRSDGFPVPDSALSVLIDRAFDMLMLLLFGFIALAILFGISPTWTLVIATIISLVIVAAFLFTRNREESAHWIATTLTRVAPKAYKETVNTDAHRLVSHIGEFELSFLILCGLLSTVNYTFLLLRMYCLILALHLAIPFWYFALVVPLLRLVALIPISIAGIGTRTVTAIYLYGRVGVSKETVLIMGVLGLLTILFQAVIGLVTWWLFPLRFDPETMQPSEPSHLRQEAVPTGEQTAL
jgi:uncharacterized protein (TIRG00374 family)